MDTILALGLLLILLLRGLPILLAIIPAQAARRLRIRFERARALLDIAGGTLMMAFVVALAWQRAWVPTTILALLSVPLWLGLWNGLRTLARTQ